MPKLPSGLLVGLSIEPALHQARAGNAMFRAMFRFIVPTPENIADAVSIVYYRPEEGNPGLGEEYLSGMTLSAIGTSRCDWPPEDIAFFNDWLSSERIIDPVR